MWGEVLVLTSKQICMWSIRKSKRLPRALLQIWNVHNGRYAESGLVDDALNTLTVLM